MEIKFDYTISDKKENNPVGYIKYLYSNEVIEFFSEKELLHEYKDYIYSAGVNSVKVKVNSTLMTPRHGLKFALLSEEAGEYGADYTKEEYEKLYKKNLIKKLNHSSR